MTKDLDRYTGFDTLALHAGQSPDSATGARAVPVYQTTAYAFESVSHAADLFSLKRDGNIYTRLMNPTTDVLEKRVAALEGGIGALAVASGTAAVVLAILNIAKSGDNFISTSYLYGGTYNLFHYTLARLGIEVRFVDSSDPAAFTRAADERTRLFYLESVGNPKNNVSDFEAVAQAAHSCGVPLVIDNTVTTPYLFRPFEHGADIAIHSLTKFMGGHGTTMGGAIVDSGKFDWNNGKFPELSEPDPSYHGVRYSSDFGSIAYITKARVQLLRDLGPSISPMNSFQILQGIETLSLRMDRHCSNAQAIAEFLLTHYAVTWVNYPGLPNHPDYVNANRYLTRGKGAIIGFGIRGGRDKGAKFIDACNLLSHVANIGDAKSLVIHPASTTHQQLTPEQLVSAGVSDDFIRLSIGLEGVDDIISDIDQALEASQR